MDGPEWWRAISFWFLESSWPFPEIEGAKMNTASYWNCQSWRGVVNSIMKVKRVSMRQQRLKTQRDLTKTSFGLSSRTSDRMCSHCWSELHEQGSEGLDGWNVFETENTGVDGWIGMFRVVWSSRQGQFNMYSMWSQLSNFPALFIMVPLLISSITMNSMAIYWSRDLFEGWQVLHWDGEVHSNRVNWAVSGTYAEFLNVSVRTRFVECELSLLECELVSNVWTALLQGKLAWTLSDLHPFQVGFCSNSLFRPVRHDRVYSWEPSSLEETALASNERSSLLASRKAAVVPLKAHCRVKSLFIIVTLLTFVCVLKSQPSKTINKPFSQATWA